MFTKQFELLERAVTRIQQQLQTADAEQKVYLAEELFALRKTCDSFLEKWIDFEELCSDIIETHQLEQFVAPEQPDSPGTVPTPDWSSQFAKKATAPVVAKGPIKMTDPLAQTLQIRSLQKGIGFFNLLMFPEAIQEFEQVVAANYEQTPVARLYLGLACLMQGRLEDARKHFRLLQHVTEEPLIIATVYQARGIIDAQAGLYQDAIQQLVKASEILPQLKDLDFNLGVCHFKLGKYVQALQYFLKTYRMDTADVEAGELCAKLWRILGFPDEAKRYAEELVQKQPGRPDFLCLLADLELELGNIMPALQSYQKAVTYAPAFGPAYTGLGWIALTEGQPEIARAYFQKHLALEPKSGEALFYLGWLLANQGEMDKAQRLFEKVLERQAADPYALIGLARIYGQTGQFSAARDFLHRVARTKDPRIKRIALVHLGRLALEQRQYDVSLRYLNAALRFDSEALETLFYKGLNYYLMGDHSRAEDYWRRCGELQPQLTVS